MEKWPERYLSLLTLLLDTLDYPVSQSFACLPKPPLCSISEILDKVQEDAEDVLFSLGFGQEDHKDTSRIPARFFTTPSQAKGIDFQLFLKSQMRRIEMEDPCLMLASECYHRYMLNFSPSLQSFTTGFSGSKSYFLLVSFTRPLSLVSLSSYAIFSEDRELWLLLLSLEEIVFKRPHITITFFRSSLFYLNQIGTMSLNLVPIFYFSVGIIECSPFIATTLKSFPFRAVVLLIMLNCEGVNKTFMFIGFSSREGRAQEYLF